MLPSTPFNWRRRSTTSTTSYPVLQEPDPERRAFLLWMTSYFKHQLLITLQTLGIDVPVYM